VTLLVVDASALVAVLTDGNGVGAAVADALAGSALAAPELLPFETANVLRRLELGGQLTRETAALAHGDLLDLAVQLWPYTALAAGAWRLRGSLTLYDAAYVALAAELDVPLVTLDQRLARTASSCQVVVPGRDGGRA
jgi:predicted nucleic acid-binding protein